VLSNSQPAGPNQKIEATDMEEGAKIVVSFVLVRVEMMVVLASCATGICPISLSILASAFNATLKTP
jgi:hypothetical protein